MTQEATSAKAKGAPGEHPASQVFSSLAPRAAASFVVVLALAASAYVLHAHGHVTLSLSLVFGGIFGVVLQRARFCFFCMFRDWLDDGNADGMIGLAVALGVGIVGYTVVFGAWLPDSTTGRLPPDAFIGPVSIALVVAGLAFGAGMAISGSCISAHLYRLGEGSPTAPFALIGSASGFVLGFLTWNPIYLSIVSDARTIWLPASLGYAGAMILGVALLALLAAAFSRRSKKSKIAAPDVDLWQKIFVQRWPAWIGGIFIGMLGAASYLRVGPLGVTAEIGSRARQAANAVGLIPIRLEGLDTLRGCVTVLRDGLLTNNGMFVLALVLTSFAAALVAGQFKPAAPTGGHIARGLIGGALLGWGTMTGLGCTVGTLLSGIMAGALSGWMFGVAVFVGIALTLRLGRRAKLLA